MSKYEIEIPDSLFNNTIDTQAQGERFLINTIDLALQGKPHPVQMDYESNAERQYLRGRACGYTSSPSISIKYESRYVDVDITVKSGADVDFVSTSSGELTITLTELHDGHECPVCGEEFDTVVWENVTDFGDNDKAEWIYACPTDCDGQVVLQTD